MEKRKKAPIFEIWREKVRNRDISWSRVAKETGLDYRWLCDLVNQETLTEQVWRVKILDRYFRTEDFDVEKYRSEKVEQIEDGGLFQK